MNKDFFNKLVTNAFDFLRTAVDQFKTKPKYSVIHFCSGIELILKARLMHEHWSLIVADQPNKKKFEAGDFRSLNFKDLMPKIEDVLNEKFPKETRDSFLTIAQHRNKIVHFFHEVDDERPSEATLEVIAAEQSSALFYLRKLLEKWGSIFKDYQHHINAIHAGMKEHKIYLDTVFKRIAPEILADQKKGAKFRNCRNCQHEASEEQELTNQLIGCRCRVCSFAELVLKILCQGCQKPIEISDYDPSHMVCVECACKINKKYLSKQLDTAEPVTKDNYMDYIRINCANCMSLGSVIEHHDYYICTECIFVADRKEMQFCGWCHEGQIYDGPMECSILTGCEFCDGHPGWGRDD